MMTNTLSVHPKDLFSLYKAYMPFVKGGGIFIPTDEEKYELGEAVTVTLTLPEGRGNLEYTGRVVWISPKKILFEESNTGIGVSIEGDKSREIKETIEKLIREYIESEQPTDTM